MKNFNKKIYAINRSSLQHIDTEIPLDYFKMASKIANSYSKDYSAIGVMNINDLNQEGYLALLTAWRNIDYFSRRLKEVICHIKWHISFFAIRASGSYKFGNFFVDFFRILCSFKCNHS